MEKNNREKKQMATKTVGGKKRKLIITTDHDDDDKKRSWSDLPYEILELIKKGLLFIDQVKFRAVCKSWSCIERVAPLQQIPWLLVVDYYHSCKLVDSTNKKTYTIGASVWNMRVHESKYGWLLISQWVTDQTRFFLFSPFFSEGYNFIELPPVLMNGSYIFYATFTSNPLEEDCKILILTKNLNDNTNTYFINTYRCGQGSWSGQNFNCKHRNAGHWIYSEGSLYYGTMKGTMEKFNLALEEWTVLPSLPPSISYQRHYTVTSSDGELFLIVECNFAKIQNRWRHESRIYRLNLSSMIWEDLDSIGDRVLFFGNRYNSVLDSSVLKLNGERTDISNMIYYCKDHEVSYCTELRYCSVHDFTLKLSENEKPPRKKNCLRHYGPIATKRCRKMWIDPPPR